MTGIIGAMALLRGECRTAGELAKLDRAEKLAWRRVARKEIPFLEAWSWVWERALAAFLRKILNDLKRVAY